MSAIINIFAAIFLLLTMGSMIIAVAYDDGRWWGIALKFFIVEMILFGLGYSLK